MSANYEKTARWRKNNPRLYAEQKARQYRLRHPKCKKSYVPSYNAEATMGDAPAMSFAQIGEALGIHVSRAEQIYKSGMEKLRRGPYRETLEVLLAESTYLRERAHFTAEVLR